MTGSFLLDTLISIGGILMLIGLSFFLRQKIDAKITSVAMAANRLSLDEPDFEAGQWAVSKDGRRALAISANGREIALIRAQGDKFATRRLPLSAVTVISHAPRLQLNISDPAWPSFTLSLNGDAPADTRLTALLSGAGAVS